MADVTALSSLAIAPGGRDRRGRLPGTRGRARRAPRRDASGSRAPSASTRRRTSARSATPAPSSPTTTTLAAPVRSLREHGQRASTSMTSRARPRAWTRSRRSCSSTSCRTSTSGTRQRRELAARYTVEPRRGRRPAAPAASRRGALRSGTSTWCGPRTRRLADYLAERGIGSGRHYPEPPHLSRAYARLVTGPGDFPVAEALSREALSLPIFPGMSEAQQETVVDVAARVLRRRLTGGPANEAPYRLLERRRVR